MNLLDEIIDKEQKEINKINERIKQIKDDILQKKDELELITGRVCKITRKGKIDLRSIKLDTEQQKAFNIIQKRKCEERKLKRAEEFQNMIKDILTKIANERNIKATQSTVIEPPKIPMVVERKRW
jgi:Mg2+ and Co2+ transporter CorA